MKRFIIFALLSLAALCLRADPPLPVIPDAVYDVTTYGAVGDGRTDNTTAIQNALNAARTAGGGTVRIPAAQSPYLSGSVTIYSKTRLQVDTGATLKALPFGTYPRSTSSPANFIITSTNSTHIVITGGGTIDGDGSGWWAAYNAGTISNRPRLIYVNHSDTALFSNITLSNSPSFALAFSASNNVTIDGVNITAPSDAPNTDAIDPAGSHYLIQNCSLVVGDDNIAIKAGSVLCTDIVVRNCYFGTGHGLSIGGQTNVGLDGLTVTDCVFEGTTSGLRMKADATQGGLVQNVTYRNIRMTNVKFPIVFYSYYNRVGNPGYLSGSSQTTPAKVATWNATPPDPLKASTIPIWRNITIDNLQSAGTSQYSIIWGLPLANALISNVTLKDLKLSGPVGLEIFNAANVQIVGDSTIDVPAGVLPFVTYNTLAISRQPAAVTTDAGGSASFSVATVGTSGINATAPSFQWLFKGQPLQEGRQEDGTVVSGSRSANLTLSSVALSHAGEYSVLVTNKLDTYNAEVTALIAGNTEVSATSRTALLSLRDNGTTAPGIVTGPKPLILSSGTAATLSVEVLGSAPLRYQWYKDGSAIAGAQAATLNIAKVSLADAGRYTVTVSNNLGTVSSEEAPLAVSEATPNSDARLFAIACRARVGAGDDVLIPGFIVGGSGSREVIVRVSGPAMGGVAGTLTQPQLRLHQIGVEGAIAENRGWSSGSETQTAALEQAMRDIGLPLFPRGSGDCALLATLQADRGYSAVVSGVNDSTGVAMVEVYERGSGSTRLSALACRARVGTGDDVLIPGIVITGNSPRRILIRASAPPGVAGTLAEPRLSIYSYGKRIATNTRWASAGNAAELMSATSSCGLANFDPASADSAILITLPPGPYSAHVSGVNDTQGVTLLEVYEVP